MDDTIDLLQIKIEKAKSALPEDTLDAIAAVPWQATVLKMRETKGYSSSNWGIWSWKRNSCFVGLYLRGTTRRSCGTG